MEEKDKSLNENSMAICLNNAYQMRDELLKHLYKTFPKEKADYIMENQYDYEFNKVIEAMGKLFWIAAKEKIIRS